MDIDCDETSKRKRATSKTRSSEHGMISKRSRGDDAMQIDTPTSSTPSSSTPSSSTTTTTTTTTTSNSNNNNNNYNNNNNNNLIIVTTPNLDLRAYVHAYTGITQIKRLLFIAERCPPLQLHAFRTAIGILKTGLNTTMYVETVSRARELLGDQLGEEWAFDQKWVTNTNRIATERQTRLEATLNNHKRDGEREQVRAAYTALAEFLIERGDFTTALTKFLETKEYGGNNKETLETCLQVIRTSIHIGSLSHVKTQVQRAKTIPEITENPVSVAQVNAAMGLYNLKGGSFRQAAQSFIGTSISINENYNEVLTGADVATYGTLCALATYSRRELEESILHNSEFKKLLELVPQWKLIVQQFQQSNYLACFTTLERFKSDLLLDIYMSPHVHRLIRQIRDRALIQYFKPFISVKLSSMATSFGLDIPTLEKHVAELIQENKIQARIDSHNKVVHARHADQRNHTFQQALIVGDRYVRDARSLLLRMSLVEHEFVVKGREEKRVGGRSGGGGGGAAQGLDDDIEMRDGSMMMGGGPGSRDGSGASRSKAGMR